jgi:hypothetical protein
MGLRLAAGSGGTPLAGGNDVLDRHGGAAGAARALTGCGWQGVHSVSLGFSLDGRGPSIVCDVSKIARRPVGVAAGADLATVQPTTESRLGQTELRLRPGSGSGSRAPLPRLRARRPMTHM